MTLLRPQVILAAHGKPQARRDLAATGVQVYSPGAMFWSKKSVILRNVPYTATSPHLGQIQARVNFGEVAKRYKGCKGFYNGLPCVAGHVQEEVRGYKAPDRMPEEAYPSKVHRSYHTLDQLEAMLAAKKRPIAAPSRGIVPPTY